jgi:small-conductance mechanosensitive channel
MFASVLGSVVGFVAFAEASPIPGSELSAAQFEQNLLTFRICIFSVGLVLSLFLAVAHAINLGLEMHKRVGRDDLLWKLTAGTSGIAMLACFVAYTATSYFIASGFGLEVVVSLLLVMGMTLAVVVNDTLSTKIKQETPYLAADCG